MSSPGNKKDRLLNEIISSKKKIEQKCSRSPLLLNWD